MVVYLTEKALDEIRRQYDEYCKLKKIYVEELGFSELEFEYMWSRNH